MYCVECLLDEENRANRVANGFCSTHFTQKLLIASAARLSIAAAGMARSPSVVPTIITVAGI